jgi:hypothetical protein
MAFFSHSFRGTTARLLRFDPFSPLGGEGARRADEGFSCQSRPSSGALRHLLLLAGEGNEGTIISISFNTCLAMT